MVEDRFELQVEWGECLGVFLHKCVLNLTVLFNWATGSKAVSYILCCVEMSAYAVCEPTVLKIL